MTNTQQHYDYLISVIGKIREATGVGQRPMLSELADAIQAEFNSLQDHNKKLHQALSDLVHDLEQRSNMKLGDDRGVVDCGHGVYIRAKSIL